MSPERIAELRALLKAHAESGADKRKWEWQPIGDAGEIVTGGDLVIATDMAPESAALASAARNALPELLDEVERLRASEAIVMSCLRAIAIVLEDDGHSSGCNDPDCGRGGERCANGKIELSALRAMDVIDPKKEQR